MFLYLLSIVFTHLIASEAYIITVYGDVYHDTTFFNRTFPWIIDNIGGEITVEFYMMGSGKYSVPQMCVLEALKLNTYLQAQYLKCEAEGNPSVCCLCDSGIDSNEFKHCVASKGYLASVAAAKFTQMGIDITPVVELGYKSTVFGVGDKWFLKKICTIFGDNLPRGCIKPFECNQNNTEPCFYKKAIAHFDGSCKRESIDSCFMKPEVPATEAATTFQNNEWSSTTIYPPN